MNRKIRLLLFLSLVLVFLVAAPSTVLYFQGYRFDIQNLRIIQTGSFYFKVIPRSVDILIVSERKDISAIESDTDFFFGTSYVENILPEKYNVTIRKEGFHSWYKSLEIKEKKVTEIKNVTLIPTDPAFNLIYDKASDIFPLPHRKEIVIKGLINDKEWDLTIYNSTNNSLNLLISSDDVPGEPSNILSSTETRDLLIDMGSYHLVINPVDGTHYMIDDIIDPLLYPGQANSVIYLDNGNLTSYDYLNEFASILTEDVETFGIRKNGNIVWLSQDGIIFEDGSRVRSAPFPIRDGSKYRILLPNQSDIAIVENDSFYFLDRNRSEFKEMFHSSKEPIPSPDLRKLAYYDDHEINILYLDDTTNQPVKKYGERSFLTRFSKKVDNVEWLNNHYLVFNIDNDIKIMEIDDRNHINIIDLANLVDPKLYFEKAGNKLYVLSDGNIFVSKTLLP